MSHIADLSAPARPSRLAWIPPTSRSIGLVVTLLTIASLEFGAGVAAGWSWWRAAGIPLSIDLFVLGTLLSAKSRRVDRLFALGLAEATVVISAVWGDHGKDGKVLLGAALATALVAVLWRQDETIRRERAHGDLLAAATARAIAAEARILELEGRTREVEAAAAAARDTFREELDRAIRRADAAEARASAAEARAADARRRDDRDDRDERPAPRTQRATSTTTDQDRREIIELVLAGGTHEPTGRTFEANPAAGRRTIADAIRNLRHTPGGNAELSKLVDEVRAKLAEEGHHLAPVRAANA